MLSLLTLKTRINNCFLFLHNLAYGLETWLDESESHDDLYREVYELVQRTLDSFPYCTWNDYSLAVQHRAWTDAYYFWKCEFIHINTAPNPNRFIKSSFALSLLWVAKFYCTLEAELEAFSSDAEQCAHAALNMFDALSQFFEKDSFFEDVLPATADWLCSSA